MSALQASDVVPGVYEITPHSVLLVVSNEKGANGLHNIIWAWLPHGSDKIISWYHHRCTESEIFLDNGWKARIVFGESE